MDYCINQIQMQTRGRECQKNFQMSLMDAPLQGTVSILLLSIEGIGRQAGKRGNNNRAYIPAGCVWLARSHSLTLAMLFQHRQKCTVVVLAVGVNNTADGRMVIIGNGRRRKREGEGEMGLRRDAKSFLVNETPHIARAQHFGQVQRSGENVVDVA